jgi:hypothetical protein
MMDNAIAIYCFLDDYLKTVNHREDTQCRMNDAAVMLIGLLSCMYFGGHYEHALQYVSEQKLFSYTLSKSRFNRRLHALEEKMQEIFQAIGNTLKQFNTSMEYMMDSFPVRICHNIRIANNHLLPLNNEYRGKCVSKREYFYGFRVQVIATVNGVPVEFAIVPGSWNDSRGMHALDMNLPEGSRNISDSAYTNYAFEDAMQEYQQIWHDTERKSNSKRTEPPYRKYYKNQIRKTIENVFSQITSKMKQTIHATSINGFILKIKLFVWSHLFEKLIIQ